MLRVRIWVSASRETENAFIVEQIGGVAECYSFIPLAGEMERLGAGYSGSFSGFPGTFYDLPRGFPTNDREAALRVRDPSISSSMRGLIRSSFPLRPRRPSFIDQRRIA